MKKLLLLSLICLPLFVSAQATSTASSTASTTEICAAVNSINVYSKENLTKLQNYIKKNFFSKLITTGIDDVQTKYYIRQFQYAYGLKVTGTLTVETLQYIKTLNKCFDLDKRISNVRTATNTVRRVTQLELLNNLLQEYIYNFFSGATTSYTTGVTVTNSTSTQQ